MPPLFDAAAFGFQSLGASMTWNHTCTGSELSLIVGLTFNGAVTGIICTYGGQPLTLVPGSSANNTVLYYMSRPPAGVASVSVSWTNSVSAEGTSISLTRTNVNPISNVGTGSASGTSSGSLSLTPNFANCMIVDVVQAGSIFSSIATTGAGQTSRVTDKSSSNIWIGSSTTPTTTPSAYTIGWNGATFTGNWFISAVAIRPSSNALYFNSLRPHPFSPGLAR